MYAFKYRDDRDYVRSSRRQTTIDTIILADENSVARPSPVHALHATLEDHLKRWPAEDPMVEQLRQSRLLVIAMLAMLCWAGVGAIAWLVLF